MGMSASQARYLSLTARKSDLEFRGQQINQSRLMLSNQSANLYSSMLSMSVPTPPVETDFMKDVYSFSMGGDNTTLSSYKLSMGKDGYGYDILYSKPATSRQLAASSSSNVQRVINRQAASGLTQNKSLKIKVGYKNADGAETFTSNQSPKKSRLITMNPQTTYTSGNIELGSEHKTATLWSQLKKSSNFSLKDEDKSTTIDKNQITCSSNMLHYDNNDLTQLSTEQLANFFGGTKGTAGTGDTYNADGGLLEKILGKETLKFNQNNSEESDKYAYQIFMDKNGDVYVFKSEKSKAANSITTTTTPPNTTRFNKENVSEIKKYKLTEILGLTQDSDAKYKIEGSDVPQDKAVYYANLYTGEKANQATDRVYFSGFSFENGNLKFYHSTASQNNLGLITTLNGHNVNKIEPKDLEKLGIEKAEEKNIDGKTTKEGNVDYTNQSAITYNYYMDKQTGDVWRQQITTSTSGDISEAWGLYKAQKQVTFDGNEAQLIDEKDWPTGVERSAYPPGEYDCYYVPDETGTGGSYYLVKNNNNAEYVPDKVTTDNNIVSAESTRQYSANNTYKIEGMTACVVSDNSVPSTIAEAYDLDNYIIYATYNDSDTDFSNPIKYYVYPKDEDSADAVCSYAYEKSYTGKNQILEGRANILVDENGRLSKLDIQGEGTYTLEYGQEKDEEAYNEAYREYEYKLEKYEKEMADIDARTAMIQQQDKKLELQLKSIDTEHSAIQTELEALKKVIDTNIKSSFGTFGG